MIVAEIFVVALVAYRVWSFLARDSLTEPLRDRINEDSYLWEWWTCPHCSGTWLAVGVALAASFTGLIEGSPWLVAPAAAAVVGLLGDRA